MAGIWVIVASIAVLTASFFIRGERQFWIGWILGAGPFTTPTLFLTYLAARRAPEIYRPFWRRFCLGLATAYSAGILAIAGYLFTIRPFIVAAALIGLASFPSFFFAGVVTLRARTANRALPIDLLDVAISVIALAAPCLYFLIVPAIRSRDPLAITLALVGMAMLGPLYIALLNFFRLPAGNRSGEVLFSTLSALTTLNVLLIVIQVLRGFTLPTPPIFAVHVANMGLLVMTPLYARSLEIELPPDHIPPFYKARRIHALPFLALMLIPPLAIYAQWHAKDRPWGPVFVISILVVLTGLGALRQYLSNKETLRLNAELEAIAEERRELLVRMVRALEAERHRFGAELHGTAVESLAAIGALLQAAYAQLPPGTAAVVREALGAVREDMNERIERMRQLMVAIEPPDLEETGLSTALVAYANELFGSSRTMKIHIEVDPDLRLDWSSQSIIYRLAQEGLLNVSKHARAKTVSVNVSACPEAVILCIVDDGRGFNPATTEKGAGLRAMETLAQLGQGDLEIRSAPQKGCTIEVKLGIVQSTSDSPRHQGRHLYLVMDSGEASKRTTDSVTSQNKESRSLSDDPAR